MKIEREDILLVGKNYIFLIKTGLADTSNPVLFYSDYEKILDSLFKTKLIEEQEFYLIHKISTDIEYRRDSMFREFVGKLCACKYVVERTPHITGIKLEDTEDIIQLTSKKLTFQIFPHNLTKTINNALEFKWTI